MYQQSNGYTQASNERKKFPIKIQVDEISAPLSRGILSWHFFFGFVWWTSSRADSEDHMGQRSEHSFKSKSRWALKPSPIASHSLPMMITEGARMKFSLSNLVCKCSRAKSTDHEHEETQPSFKSKARYDEIRWTPNLHYVHELLQSKYRLQLIGYD